MKIYIDESGNFDFKNQDETSLVCAVMFPENLNVKLAKFWKRFEDMCSNYERDERGEIKGNKLSKENLCRIYSFISQNIDFRISVIVFPHKGCTKLLIEKHRAEQIDRFQNSQATYMEGPVKSDEINNFMEKVIKLIETIDPYHYAQGQIMTELIDISIRKMFVYYMGSRYNHAFKNFDFFCDQLTNKKMKRYIVGSIKKFIEYRSKEDPICTIEGFEYSGDSFHNLLIERSDGGSYYDSQKIFSSDVKFVDSKDEVGVRLADILASSINQIIKGDRDAALFNMIRKNCSYFQSRFDALEIVNFFSKNEAHKNDLPEILIFLQMPPKRPGLILGKWSLKHIKKVEKGAFNTRFLK